MSERSKEKMLRLLDAGDVVGAIMASPYGYTSRHVPGGFRFAFNSGPLRGQVGEAPTLLEAVRIAVREAA